MLENGNELACLVRFGMFPHACRVPCISPAGEIHDAIILYISHCSLTPVPPASTTPRTSGLYPWRYIYPLLKKTPFRSRYTARGFTQSSPASPKQEQPGPTRKRFSAMGRLFWTVTHPFSCFKMQRTENALVNLMASSITVLLVLLWNLERVPVSGRLQFRIKVPVQLLEPMVSVALSMERMKPIQKNNEEQKVDSKPDPRVTHFQQIFERVLSVSGFEPSKSKLLCLDMPGQISFVVPVLMLPLIVTDGY